MIIIKLINNFNLNDKILSVAVKSLKFIITGNDNGLKKNVKPLLNMIKLYFVYYSLQMLQKTINGCRRKIIRPAKLFINKSVINL